MTNPPNDTAELLTRLHASEPGIGLRLYDRFADRIHDFVVFLTRDAAMAAETTRDVIVMTAHQDPAALSDPATLRAWLYAQARNETFALLSTRGRTPPADRVVEIPELPEHPTTADLGWLVWTAMAAFSERDQALVTLHLRHGLEDAALADAMGLSAGAVEVLLPATLERVETQTAALLALATDQLPTDCPDLQAVVAEWDGMFSPLVRGRVAQMLHDSGATAETTGPGPLALLQTIPLCPAPASLREAVGERLALATRLGAGGTAVDPEIDDTVPPGLVAAAAVDRAADGGDGAGLPGAAVASGLGPDETTIPPGEGPAVVPPTASPGMLPAAAPTAGTSAVGAPAVAAETAGSHAVGSHAVGSEAVGSDAAIAAEAGRPDPVAREAAPFAPPHPSANPAASDPAGIALAGASPVTPSGTEITGEVTGPVEAPRPSRTPLPLALALGIAVGLVIAAAAFRFVSGDVAPAEVAEIVSPVPSPPVASASDLPDVTAPMSAAAGAAMMPATGPSEAPSPGRLSGPGEEVLIAAEEPTALRLTNSGGTALDWRVTTQPDWVVLDRMEGRIDPGATVELEVQMAQPLAEGDHVGEVTFAWEGAEPGMTTAVLTGAVERIPELQNLRVGSRQLEARDCGQDQTEIEVLVADESPIAEVLVTATGPGPDTQTQYTLTPDPTVAGRFIGIIGPFDAGGVAILEIEGSDVRGNRAAAAGGELSVTAC